MPHKCVACDTAYDDESEVVITGCVCGSKVFQYVRKNGLINPETEGIYDLNIQKLFRQEQSSEQPLVIRKEGSYEIDIERALREPLKRKSS